MLLHSPGILPSQWGAGEGNRTPFPKAVPRDRCGDEAPILDFETSKVIAVSMRVRPTGGYDIGIEGLYLSGVDLHVHVVETSPGRSRVVADAMTGPVVLRVPRLGIILEESRSGKC